LKSIVLLTFQFCWSVFKTRKSLVLENLMLRQQLIIYKRKNKRPKLENIDRIILVWISRVFSKWKSVLVVAKAATLIGWHRKGFKLYWKRKSRRVGRPNINWELIKLVRRM
jgi:putative transposase